jgi:hypothetical protein
MLFLGGAINSAGFAGKPAPRLRVPGAGDSALAYAAEGSGAIVHVKAMAGDLIQVREASLAGSKTARGTGSASAVLVGDLLGTCARKTLGGEVSVERDAGFSPSVRRGAAGSAIATLAGSLFYSKTSLLTGSLLTDHRAFAYIGVIFIDGQTVMLTYPELTANRKKTGSGTATAAASMTGTASAVRRHTTPGGFPPAIIERDATLDSASIHAGVRTINFSSFPVTSIRMSESGMNRQASVGLIDHGFTAEGTASARRSLPGSSSTKVFTAELTPAIRRFGSSNSMVTVASASGSGQVYTIAPMESTSVVSFSGGGSVSAYRGCEAVHATEFDAGGEMQRGPSGSGDAVAPACYGDLNLTKVKTMWGAVVLELGTGGEIYEYQNREDTINFVRPSAGSAFTKPSILREWRRT